MERFKDLQMLIVMLSNQVKTKHHLSKLKNQYEIDLTTCK